MWPMLRRMPSLAMVRIVTSLQHSGAMVVRRTVLKERMSLSSRSVGCMAKGGCAPRCFCCE